MKSRMNKKAISPLTLFLIVISIAGAIAYIYLEFFAYSWGAETLREFPDDLCASALEKQASNAYIEEDYLKQWPDTCKMREKLVKTTDTSEAEKQILGMMDRCWTMMGKGSFNPFENKDSRVSQIGYKRCFVCFRFTMQGMGSEITDDMLNKLMAEQYPEGKTFTYYHSFTQSSADAYPERAGIPFILENIRNNEKYALTFWDISSPFWYGWAENNKGMDGIAPRSVEKGMVKMFITGYKDAKPCVDVSV